MDSIIPGPDASPNLVTLTVKIAGAAQPGIRVYFQNADGSLVSNTTTDATGTASAQMADGGTVTAVEPYGANTDDVETFAGVKGGDHLLLEQPGSPSSISFSLIFPPDAVNTISTYSVHTNCGDQYDVTPTGSTINLVGCGATIDLLVEGLDAQDHTVSAFFHPDAAITSGGTLTLTDTLVAVGDSTLTYTNAPNVLGGRIYVTGALVSPKGRVYTFSQRMLTATAGSASTTVTIPSVTGAVQIFDTTTNLTSSGSQHVMEWRAPSTTYTLDVESHLLAGYNSFPQFDAASHAFTWTLTGSQPQGDFVLASAQISRSAAKRSWTWNIATPANGPTVTLPVIPVDSFDFNAGPTDDGGLGGLVTAKVPGGYDAVRAHILSTSGPTDLISGTSGTLVYETGD